ncbi:MAG: DUF4142 domain-containing protein [Caulobacteraceae bacterium]
MRVKALMLTTALAAALAVSACQKTGAADNKAATADVSPAAASATPPPPAATPAPDATTAQGFVTAAATSDMYEIAAAKLAQQKSKTPAVETFAAKMIHDHGESTAALKKLLTGVGVNATAPAAMDDRHNGMINDLNQAPASGFDKAYMDQQVAAHTEAAALFQGYVSGGDNDSLKKFAAKVLPTIQSHLAMAKQMDGSMQ